MIDKLIDLWDKTHGPQLRTFRRWEGRAPVKECTRCKRALWPVGGTIAGLFGRRLSLCQACVFYLRLVGLIAEPTSEDADTGRGHAPVRPDAYAGAWKTLMRVYCLVAGHDRAVHADGRLRCVRCAHVDQITFGGTKTAWVAVPLDWKHLPGDVQDSCRVCSTGVWRSPQIPRRAFVVCAPCALNALQEG